MSRYTDTCDWCGRGTNKLQLSGNIGLCPYCCPELDAESLPETDSLPSSWYHMTEKEREMWLDGMTIKEIMHENDWITPPDR